VNDAIQPLKQVGAPPLRDRLGRVLRDLRVSVTDRCNFRCVYCMPKEVFGKDYQFLERRELLSFEEIARAVRRVKPAWPRRRTRRRGRRSSAPRHRAGR